MAKSEEDEVRAVQLCLIWVYIMTVSSKVKLKVLSFLAYFLFVVNFNGQQKAPEQHHIDIFTHLSFILLFRHAERVT